MKVSIIIPNYNGGEYLVECLRTLKAQTYTDFETILVDNASIDSSIEVAQTIIPDIICLKFEENKGFSAAVNYGIQNSQSEYIVLLNNDTVLTTSWLAHLVLCMEDNPKAFSCASKMIQYYHQSNIDNVGDALTIFGWAYQEGHGNSKDMFINNRKIFTACAGAAIYRKIIFQEIGYFDENFFAYLEDVDIGYRARIQGYINLYCADAILYHIGSATTGNGYNAIKVKLSARNNVFLIYKNMLGIQLLLNAPFMLIGHIFKYYFYKKIGFQKEYSEGIRQGFANRTLVIKTKFQFKNINNYFIIQGWLIRKGLLYGFAKLKKVIKQ